ncbi:hypothetical protein F5141DRAFT_1092528 [Pisolithus sp. B1]|nr:hypothetical protein F5141DRAFT_1092528 [Pisolithus sp. B1]
MTSYPPSSQTGSASNSSKTAQQQPALASLPTSGLPNQTQLPTHQQNLQYVQAQPHTQTTPAARQNPAQTYYTMGYPPGSWQNTAWQLSGYPYATTGSAPYQQTHYAQIPYTQYQSYQHAPPARQRTKLQPKLRTPTPEPTYRHWDEVIRAFLKKVGLSQALKGFEDDMIVMNEDWERKVVPGAIGELVRDMMTLGKYKDGEKLQERPLEDRKLDYIHLNGGQQPRSQSTITKSVSQFLAENRAKNDASNRSEFLQSIAEKRRRLDIGEDRTDMKQLDREVQMKYDIAKNEDGPLRRTVHGVNRKEAQEKPVALSEGSESKDHPALDERLKNIEAHLAVRYVPAPPRNLLSRLQFLEDHITQLEKEYPPWAALHFNQPDREWPPPPRQTPIIVPSHLTTQEAPAESTVVQHTSSGSGTPSDDPSTSLAKGKAKTKSSLHRAVMEKLEVQRAMSDLAGLRKGG